MSNQFSHTIKAETVTVSYFPRSANQSQVHKAGCAHEAKAERVGKPENAAEFVHVTETKYVDDWFYVAACARRA
jgi:hypothetical protein